MKRWLLRLGATSFAVVSGVGAVGCAGGPSGQDRYGARVDQCWPERYAYKAREPVVGAFAAHVSNGNIVDHTVTNYMFVPGSDKLTPGGFQRLDYLARRRPEPDGKVYLQTARDVGYDASNPDGSIASRQELDAKRSAAIQQYYAASTAGRSAPLEVQVVDSPDLTISAQGQANAMRVWPTMYTADASATRGGGGTVAGTGRGGATTNTSGGGGNSSGGSGGGSGGSGGGAR